MLAPTAFDARDWYWQIVQDIHEMKAAPATSVYSSKRNIYVDPATDADYIAWRDATTCEPNKAHNESGIWYHVKDFKPAWLYDGATFSQPSIDKYHAFQLSQYSAMKRWETETKGIKASGVPMKTDDRSKQMIGNARQAAVADSSFTTTWVGSDGNLYPVNATDMIKMGDAVIGHVDACFDAFANLDPQIRRGAITTLKQIEDAYAGIG
jgi:hypothetical protein